LTCDIRKVPRPKDNPQRVVTTRGPSLSLSPPIAIASKPMIIQESEKAPEITALLHPNSDIIGLKKIPKEKCTAWLARKTMNIMATMM
jgi:hypothetical protein